MLSTLKRESSNAQPEELHAVIEADIAGSEGCPWSSAAMKGHGMRGPAQTTFRRNRLRGVVVFRVIILHLLADASDSTSAASKFLGDFQGL